jgi:hypothetical protein
MPVPLPQNNESVGLESSRDHGDALAGVRLGTKMPGAGALVDLPHPAGKPALFGVRVVHVVRPRAALTFAISDATSVRF